MAQMSQAEAEVATSPLNIDTKLKAFIELHGYEKCCGLSQNYGNSLRTCTRTAQHFLNAELTEERLRRRGRRSIDASDYLQGSFQLERLAQPAKGNVGTPNQQ